MTVLVVEVLSADGEHWDEISRYRSDETYMSGRHAPQKAMLGKDIAAEDARTFVFGYGRASRVREI